MTLNHLYQKFRNITIAKRLFKYQSTKKLQCLTVFTLVTVFDSDIFFSSNSELGQLWSNLDAKSCCQLPSKCIVGITTITIAERYTQ